MSPSDAIESRAINPAQKRAGGIMTEVFDYRLKHAEEELAELKAELVTERAARKNFEAAQREKEVRQLRYGITVLGMVVMTLGGFVVQIVRGKIGI